MPRYTVRMSDREKGVLIERTVSIDAKGVLAARKMAMALYGSDEAAVVSVQREPHFEHRQHKYRWTAERQSDGTFCAVEYAPIGPGARTGKATRWKPTREAHFRTRAAAKDCARQWYDAAKAKDTGAKAAEEQERQVPPLRAAFALMEPSLGTCKNCGGQLHVTRGQSGERFAVCSGEDEGEPQWMSMEARLTRGCGQTFPLPQRGNLWPSGRTCTCGWPLIEVVPPYVDSRAWVQCIDIDCTNLRDEWHRPEG